MTRRIIHKRNLPRSKPARAVHYAAERWEPEVFDGFNRALRRTRRAFNVEVVASALARNAPEIAVAAMPWDEFERALGDHVLPAIREALADGAAAAARDLRTTFSKADDPRFQITAGFSFDLDNPRTQTWLARYGARLVTFLRDETRLAIRAITLEAQRRGLDVTQQATRIAQALRRDVGLNRRQATALARFEAGLEEQGVSQTRVNQQVGEYRDRLIDQRARTIARHETMTASNQGQQEVWTQAAESDLLDPNETRRKWVTQPGLNATNPCPICEPMHGQLRGLNEEFVSPFNGTVAMNPPAHVNCECVTVLVFDDDE